MKIETLKKLIEFEYERNSSNTFKFKAAVLKLLDLYEEDFKEKASIEEEIKSTQKAL